MNFRMTAVPISPASQPCPSLSPLFPHCVSPSAKNQLHLEKQLSSEKVPHAERAWSFFKSIGSPQYHVAPMVDQVWESDLSANLPDQAKTNWWILHLQSELPFRILCRRNGAQCAYTPMLHARIFTENATYRLRAMGT
jgi:hypothetical protein